MAESCEMLATFAKLIEKMRWCILIFWGLACCLGGLGAMHFLEVTTISFDPPPTARAFAANKRMAEVFPEVATSTQFVTLLEAEPPQLVLELPLFVNFTMTFRERLNSTQKLTDFKSFVTMLHEDGIDPGSSMTSADGKGTLVSFSIRERFTDPEAQEFAKTAEAVLRQTVSEFIPELSLGEIISLPTITNVAIEDTEASMGTMDAIALPIAFAILGSVVRSVRLLLLPLITVSTSLSVSFGIMYCVGLIEPVQMSTPSMMMSLLIAMSIDYSLFFLTRFREELEGPLRHDVDAARRVRTAVRGTMRTAGFTVLLSGFTLMLSFSMICIFPVDVIASMGQGCTVSLLVALLVHLTMLPAILCAFPTFFSKCVAPPKDPQASLGISLQELGAESGSGALPIEVSLARKEREQKFSRVFVFLGRLATTYPQNLFMVFGIIAATVAVGASVMHMNISQEMVMSVPHGTPTYAGMEHLSKTFGTGIITPYSLMMEPTEGTVYNADFWHLTQDLLKEMGETLPYTNPKDFNFASRAQGINVPYTLVQECRGSHASWPMLQKTCSMVNYPQRTFVKGDGTAMYGLILLSEFDPMGSDGPVWLEQARELLDDFERRHNYNIRLTLTGSAADALDIMQKTYEMFPYMIVLTLGCAMLVLGVAYRSIVVPLRSLLTMLLTLLWVYGGGVLTYQYGVLQWTGLWGLTGTFHCQYWMMPVVCFSMVVGICLDYDIFLLSRIAEKREEGMSPDEAIRQGLCETGGIISAAGLIMAIAFGGLMFTSMLLVNLIGFYMVFAVLYDTFLVSCFLSPALMSLLGRFHWYPSALYLEGDSDEHSDKVTESTADDFFDVASADGTSKATSRPSCAGHGS